MLDAEGCRHRRTQAARRGASRRRLARCSPHLGRRRRRGRQRVCVVPAALASKDTWPGALDVAVGGHLRAGETLAEAVREAEEEIGLAVALDDLVRLGRRFARSDSGRDNEVQEVFAVRSDRRLGEYRLHEDEVESVVSRAA